MVRDLLLMGIPRGGTTLACKLAGQCENALALFEPMDVTTFDSHRDANLRKIDAFLSSVRAGVALHGTAPSKQKDGHVPDNPFTGRVGDDVRALQVSVGPVRPVGRLDEDFTLVVKHNAAFIAMLPELADRFECVAVVRNPVDVLRSWASVPLPVREGRLPAGERIDPDLGRGLDAMASVFARQLHLLEWMFDRITRYMPRERVLTYEGIISSSGRALYSTLALAPGAETPLAPRAMSAGAGSQDLGLRELLRREGAWRQWYSDAEMGAAAGNEE